MNTTDDIHTLTGAYVLDAVSDIERRAFEKHVTQCQACRQEVVELQETTARLGQTTTVTPPPDLWDTVHRATSATRQLLPLPEVVRARPERRRWLVRVAIGAVAASLVGIITLGIGMANREADLENQLAQSHSQVDRINTILGAPDATVTQRSEPDGRAVTAVISRQANGLVLTAKGLPALSPDQSFQGWFVTKDGRKSSMGLLPASHGTLLVRDLTTAKDTSFLAITVEPRAGSVSPSGNVMITVPASL
nr:anti-sigma factor [Kibdelosporangium sp. MJ126-NF4]